ncbi:MAG TPA: fibrobacter succinogenes major paralogous domain-containing protein [Bacteroidales bacterium]|nr:fibrobacter succinogenes major paralogous domain-containing protein [Bacteroidales bacterium]
MQQKKIILFLLILFCIGLKGLHAQTVTDIDGNIYLTITIGKQVWMAENLKTTKFNYGTAILLVTDNNAWKELKTPAYCWFNNDIENKELFGALYNWYTVNTKKLCPKGWHVPTKTDWATLVTYLGGQSMAGNKLKEKGTAHWEILDNRVTNEFDFTALPGGLRIASGVFPTFGNSYAVWWMATEKDPVVAWNYGLYFRSSKLFSGFDKKVNGFSVRCLRD